MEKFKRKWNLNSLKAHGENLHSDQEVVEESLRPLFYLIAQYIRKDLINANYCGIFYNLSPDSTVTTARPLDRRKIE